ncbi:uncharacterized protein LOC106088301 [Stomoxys calcitrans]|uniref:Uncharacterized protein n=1 Tax=Stomoxys calcitrans TaxID=35570 RepID=A0A1I8PAS4_STOCA|nr:uncharacterized protein LOC106088301 [Stomoxys calcitrans]
MNILKILFAISLILKISSAAKEPSKRDKLLEFALPKHRQAIRIFLMLQEPWHLNVLRDLDELIENDNEAYSPLYDVYRDSVENFLDAFKIYAQDQQNCAKAENLVEKIAATRELLYSTDDTRFKKLLESHSIDTLDVYEHYTLEFYDRFAHEFLAYESSLSEEQQEQEQNFIKWFNDFVEEKDFMRKTEKFGQFFEFFEQMKHDTSTCKCLL